MNRLAHHQGIHKFFMTLGIVLEIDLEASRSYRRCLDDQRIFRNADQSSSLELSSQPSNDAQPLFHEKPLG